MTIKQAEKHIARLSKLFPKAFIRTTNDFYGTDSDHVGLWTGFLEDGTIDDYGVEDTKLSKYLKKHGLYMEPYDSGTMMIWEG